MALLSETSGFGQSGRKETEGVAGKYDITLVASETYGPKDTDMTPQITKIKGSEGARLPAAALLIADKLDAKDPQKPVVSAYAKAFGDKWKTDVSTFGGHAYDGLMLAVEAIRKSGGTDKAKLRDAIEATKGYIGTGGVVNMSPTDHMGLNLSAFRMLEIKNGDWSLAN